MPWKFFWLPALGILSVVLVLAACGSDEPELPDTTSASLMAYLDEVDYQANWSLWPDSSEKYPGEDPHGALLTIDEDRVLARARHWRARIGRESR